MHLPHRFRETEFRKYEPTIARIVAAFPKQVELSSGTLAPTTFVARLRDAMTSFKKHVWPSPIDYEQFCNVRLQLHICHDHTTGKVIARKRGDKDPPLTDAVQVEAFDKVSAFDVGALCFYEVKLLFKLAHSRQLKQPVKFNCPECEELIIPYKELQEQHDVFVEKTVNGYIIT